MIDSTMSFNNNIISLVTDTKTADNAGATKNHILKVPPNSKYTISQMLDK